MSDSIDSKPQEISTHTDSDPGSMSNPVPKSEDSHIKNEPEPEPVQHDPTAPFPPTSVVLAKVKGYPPWPAMVLEELILPEYITNKKPKSISGPKTKSGKPIAILPVRFFSDDTYIWIKTSDINPLTVDMIEAFLSKPSKRKDNLLQSAYELAKNPLDMELFVKYGSSGKPPPEPEPVEEMDVDEEDDEEEEDDGDGGDGEEPPRKRKKPGPKSKGKTLGSGSTESKKRGKPGPKPKTGTKASKAGTKASGAKSGSKAKLSAKSSAKSSANTKKSTTKPKPEPEEIDPDWGIEQNIKDLYKEGNYIFENKSEQMQFQNEFPTGETISGDLSIKTKKFHEISHKLVPKLLDLTIDNETETLLKKSLSIHFPKALVLKSKLFKVLVLTNRKAIDPNQRQLINDVLTQWGDFTIDENPEVLEESGVNTPGDNTSNNTPVPDIKPDTSAIATSASDTQANGTH